MHPCKLLRGTVIPGPCNSILYQRLLYIASASLQRRPSRAWILAADFLSDPTYREGRTMVGRIMMSTDAAKLSHSEISTRSGSILHQDCRGDSSRKPKLSRFSSQIPDKWTTCWLVDHVFQQTSPARARILDLLHLKTSRLRIHLQERCLFLATMSRLALNYHRHKKPTLSWPFPTRVC